jgi:hypothetical protein
MIVVGVKLDEKPPELRRAFRNSASAEHHAARDLRYRCPLFVYLVPRYHLPDTLHIDPHSDVMGTLTLALRFSEAVELRSRQCERHPDSGDIRSSLLRTEPLHPTASVDTYQSIPSHE